MIKLLKNSVKHIFILFILGVLSFGLYGCGMSQVSKTDNLKSNLFYRLGIGYYQAGNYIKAMQEFIKAKRLNPYAARNFNAIGMVYMRTHRKGKAVLAFKNAISINSKFSDAYYNLALIYIGENNYKEAKTNLKDALKNPFYNRPYESYTLLAKIYIKEKQLKKAKKILLISESLNKKYFLTYYYLGKIYLLTSDYSKSMTYFKRTLVVDQYFIPAKYEEGVVYFKSNRFKEAKSIFNKIYYSKNSGKYRSKARKYIKKIEHLFGR